MCIPVNVRPELPFSSSKSPGTFDFTCALKLHCKTFFLKVKGQEDNRCANGWEKLQLFHSDFFFFEDGDFYLLRKMSPLLTLLLFFPKEFTSRKKVGCTRGVFTIHYRLHLCGYFPGVVNCSDLSAVVSF